MQHTLESQSSQLLFETKSRLFDDFFLQPLADEIPFQFANDKCNNTKQKYCIQVLKDYLRTPTIVINDNTEVALGPEVRQWKDELSLNIDNNAEELYLKLHKKTTDKFQSIFNWNEEKASQYASLCMHLSYQYQYKDTCGLCNRIISKDNIQILHKAIKFDYLLKVVSNSDNSECFEINIIISSANQQQANEKYEYTIAYSVDVTQKTIKCKIQYNDEYPYSKLECIMFLYNYTHDTSEFINEHKQSIFNIDDLTMQNFIQILKDNVKTQDELSYIYLYLVQNNLQSQNYDIKSNGWAIATFLPKEEYKVLSTLLTIIEKFSEKRLDTALRDTLRNTQEFLHEIQKRYNELHNNSSIIKAIIYKIYIIVYHTLEYFNLVSCPHSLLSHDNKVLWQDLVANIKADSLIERQID